MKTHQQHGLSWNLGGLLGSAAGCSTWMILTPFATGWSFVGIAVALACAISILATVPILWRVKTNLRALRGLHILLSVAFLATLAFLLYAHFTELPILASWPPTITSNASDYFWALLIFPALGMLFWFIDQQNNKESEQGGDGDAEEAV